MSGKSLLDLLDPFHREQIRGIFAIGTVASIVALRDRVDPNTAYFNVRIVSLIDLLLFFWVAYIFLMALGVSEDIFGKRFSGLCVGLARFSFGIGIMLLLIILVPAFLAQAYNWLLSLPREVILVGILAIIYLLVKTGRKRQAKQQVSKPKSSPTESRP